jgi:hypothetical protein
MKRVVIFSVILLSALSAQAHKFYMSITEINYNAQTDKLEVIIKLFTDDLEVALREGSEKKLYLGTEKEASSSDSLMADYVSRHFILNAGKQPLPYDFLGKEYDQDYTWLYLEYELDTSLKDLFLRNSLLMAAFPEQVNKVNYRLHHATGSVSLHKDHLTAVLD